MNKQILNSKSNSGVMKKVRINDFSMSKFDAVSTIKSPQSKTGMPINMSILHSMSQLETLLQNNPYNSNRNWLYKPAFRNIEVEKPLQDNSINNITFNRPGISGLDMNANHYYYQVLEMEK